VFIEGAEQAQPLTIWQSLTDALATQDLFTVHLVALEDLLERVLLWRVAWLPIVDLLSLFDRVITSHLDLYSKLIIICFES